MMETYRHFRLHREAKPIPTAAFDCEAVHEDYDGAPDAGDNRLFHGATLTSLVEQIDDYWLEECTECDGEGRHWNNADKTGGQYVPCETCGEGFAASSTRKGGAA